MLSRILPAIVLAGTSLTLAAQSSLSFEIASDSYMVDNQNGYTPAIASGDFNNDGKPDLVQCCNSSGLVFRAGNGDGTFQAPSTAAALPNSDNVEDLIATDVNGDGKLDLVAMVVGYSEYSGEAGRDFAVWLGNGDGTFQAPRIFTTAVSSSNPLTDLAVGDFFGDGHPDVAVGEVDGTVELFKNDGNGTFVSAKTITLGSASGTPPTVVGVAAGDLNGNGVSDIAAAVENTSTKTAAGAVYVLWNGGSGNFTQQSLGSYDYPTVAISRLNGIAQFDVLVGYSNSATSDNYTGVDVYYGQGANKLVKRTVVSQSGFTLWQLAGVDINGDGYGDIVAAGYGPGSPSGSVYASLMVWLGNANGTFSSTAQDFAVANESDIGPWTMGDFNRDGMMDIAIDTGLDLNAMILTNATPRAACGKYTISPTVTVCDPVDATYSTIPVRVQATSYDTTPVTAMQEYIDGSLEYSEGVTSFDTTFKVDPGSHLLVTKAWDKSGHDFVADRTITAYDGTPGPVCAASTDTASLCLPSTASVSSPVEILANGNTGNSMATAAQLYIDGKLVIDNKGPCYSSGCDEGYTVVQTSQSLAAGSHDLVFKVWDEAGKVYEAQKTITVK